MSTLIKENIAKVATNKATMKQLRVENNQLLRDVIKESINQFKELKNDNFFKNVEKRKLIEVLKVRNETKSDLFGSSFDYIELNINITLSEVSPSLFKDLVKLTKEGYISKNSFKDINTNRDYLSLRNKGLNDKKETK